MKALLWKKIKTKAKNDKDKIDRDKYIGNDKAKKKRQSKDDDEELER